MDTLITSRGFKYIELVDLKGHSFSLQQSSLASYRAVWFGQKERMQLTRPHYLLFREALDSKAYKMNFTDHDRRPCCITVHSTHIAIKVYEESMFISKGVFAQLLAHMDEWTK